MIQQKTVTVQGTEYMLTHLPAIRGTRMLKRLVKLVGPAMATFQKEQDLGGAMSALFDNLDDNVEALIVELVASATKQNMAIHFDSEFAGQYDKLALLVKEIVEFNYGSVFSLLGSDANFPTL